MKSLDIGQFNLPNCISAVQSEPIVVTQSGEPVAVIVGVSGMDEEQIELGASSDFWKMIQARRSEPKISRDEVNKRLANG